MEFLQAFPIAIIDEDYEGKHAAGRGMRQLAAAIEKEGYRVVAGLSYAGRAAAGQRLQHRIVLAGLRRRRGGHPGAMADPGGGAGRQAQSQRPVADLSVRRRAHGGNGSGKRAQARERLHAVVRGLGRVPGPRHRPLGAALPRAPAAADVQGAHGLHAARQLLVAHARSRRRDGVPQEPGRPAVLRVLRREHAALRHLGVGRAARVAARPHRADRRGRAQRGAHLRRGRNPVRGRRHVDVEQDRLARHGFSRRPRAVRPQLPQVDPALAGHDRGHADLPRPLAQRAGDHRTDLARPVHAGVDPRQDRGEPACEGDERQGPSHGDDQLHLRRPVLQRRRHQADARRYGRRAALRRGLVRLREFPRVLRRLSRHFFGAPRALAARHHLRHAVHAQAPGRAVAGVDDPRSARRRAAAGHGALQRGVHDAHLDLAPVRHHRLLRRRGRDDGAACRAGARAGDDRRGAELPPRHDRGEAAAGRLVVVRRLAARCDGQAPDR